MIRAILLDAGGVYLQGSLGDFLGKANEVLGIEKTLTTTDEVVFDPDFNRGKIGIEQCFTNVFQKDITDEQMQKLIELWKTTWTLDPEMHDLVKRLKAKGYTLGILSNSDPVNSEEYKRKGWYDVFDHLILSHEEGYLKPEHIIYGIAIERFGMPGYDILFTDDVERNLPPAEQLTMMTHLWESMPKFKQALRSQGIRYE
jgi:HAD superfamily hydrolase (TIGR01509 family)